MNSIAAVAANKTIFIRSGEFAFSAEQEEILTLLGSCVAVCIFDTRLQIGGANHFLLPRSGGPGQMDNPLNYAESSIKALLQKFKERGSQPADLRAKIVGGANPEQQITMAIGALNAEVAERTLQRYGIKVVARAIGGVKGRKIRFHTGTGALLVKEIEQGPLRLEPLMPTHSQGALEKIKVLIVEDSKPMRLLLRDLILADPRFEVVGEAENPIVAEKIRLQQQVDVMTLDLNMPEMDGCTYLQNLMIQRPVPTILVTDASIQESEKVIQALEFGAFDYIKKPSFSDRETLGVRLRESLSLASRVRLSTLRKSNPSHSLSQQQPTVGLNVAKYKVIFIGASTGGTEAIKEVLVSMPLNSPPIVMVQHMPPVFTTQFAKRLDHLCQIKVKEAADGELLLNGHAYLCPGGRHIKLKERDGQMFIQLTEDPPVNRFCPSVDYLFESASQLSNIRKCAALLLTGMGEDGARGLLKLSQLGCYTVAQDEESSVVFGMPRAAIELGGAQRIMSLQEMAKYFSN